jgi:two-component system sensor histidine kinase YesM
MTGPGRRLKSLSVYVFLLILVFLLLPIYFSFFAIKTFYENYIRQELSNQIIANIKRGEEELYNAFHRIATISNMFTQDEKLITLLADDNSSYYERNKQFDVMVQSLSNNNLFDLNNIKITMLDNKNQSYANWSLNYNDYSFILEQEWVKESMMGKGHISWSLFSPSFVREEKEQYISLARSILFPFYTGERIATLIISINQREINTILSKSGDTDFAYICTQDTMEEVFVMDKVNALRGEDIRGLMREITGKNRGSLLCELDKVRYLLSYYSLTTPWSFNGQPLVALHFTNYQRITDQLSAYSRDINYGMLIFLGILMAIMIIISRTIARPIRWLDEQVKQYAQTRDISRFKINRNDEIGSLGRSFFDMGIKINDLFDKLRQESEIREQYRFKALRAQINPHFLFNTLNTIRWMALIRKADNIADTINSLVKILEYSIKEEREFVTLGEELDMIRNYIHIQNYRYGEDLEVAIDIPKELEEYRIIKFILQPVVENAFSHAFKNISRKKRIHISGKEEKDRLKIFVRDNGAGIEPDRVFELNEELHRENQTRTAGIGLSNVHERIKVEYGEDFGLYVESVPGEGTTVTYTIPLLKWRSRT